MVLSFAMFRRARLSSLREPGSFALRAVVGRGSGRQTIAITSSNNHNQYQNRMYSAIFSNCFLLVVKVGESWKRVRVVGQHITQYSNLVSSLCIMANPLLGSFYGSSSTSVILQSTNEAPLFFVFSKIAFQGFEALPRINDQGFYRLTTLLMALHNDHSKYKLQSQTNAYHKTARYIM